MVNITQTQGNAPAGVRYDRAANLSGRPRMVLPDEGRRSGTPASAPAGREESPTALGKETLEQLAKEANQLLPASTALRFQVDRDLEQVVVKVVDNQSNEVIRQIPNEEMIGLVKRMKTYRSGLMNALA